VIVLHTDSVSSSDSHSAVMDGHAIWDINKGTTSGSASGSDSADSDSDDSNGFASTIRSATTRLVVVGDDEDMTEGEMMTDNDLSNSDALRQDGLDIGGDDIFWSAQDYVVIDEAHSANKHDEGKLTVSLKALDSLKEGSDGDGNGNGNGLEWARSGAGTVHHLEIDLSPSTLAMTWSCLLVFICCLCTACWLCRTVSELTGCSFESALEVDFG